VERRHQPILEVGNPTDPFIPRRHAIAMRRLLAKVRLFTVHRYGHTAFLTPEYLRRELHDRLLPHWCPPAEGPRARGLTSMGGAAQ
jgi:hypothetical protein